MKLDWRCDIFLVVLGGGPGCISFGHSGQKIFLPSATDNFVKLQNKLYKTYWAVLNFDPKFPNYNTCTSITTHTVAISENSSQ